MNSKAWVTAIGVLGLLQACDHEITLHLRADRDGIEQIVDAPTAGPRLIVQLYDHPNDQAPNHVVELHGSQVVNLSSIRFADKAAKLVIKKGQSYREGDRLHLIDDCSSRNPDEHWLAPGVHNLHTIDWAERIACLACDEG